MSNERQMHDDHHKENREHADWLRDISHWRVDHRNALAILSRVEATIHEFEAEAEALAATIRDHHLHILHHERELGSNVSPELHEMYEKAHKERAAAHADIRVHHAALHERHEQMMNNLGALFEELAND